VGLGTLEREAASIDVDFRTRGRRADEAIDVMRKLWAGGPEGVTHHGEFFALDEVCLYPKPVNGDIPLHVGGSNAAAARRAGEPGDGYFPGGQLSSSDREYQLEMMRHAATAMGRHPDALQYSRWGSVDLDPAGVETYAQQGANRIVVSMPIGPVEDQLGGADPLLRREHCPLSRFRSAHELAPARLRGRT
jgi:alkanesulfonate monooxygenase SsuD/methylene tetrahydromethanopterin reductase-like flavin-dependent oxidoreductase (luciferase family)